MLILFLTLILVIKLTVLRQSNCLRNKILADLSSKSDSDTERLLSE